MDFSTKFDEKIIKSINLFYSSDLIVKFRNTKIPIYPGVLILNTPLFDVLDNKELLNTPVIDKEILDEELFSFNFVWLFLNGIITVDSVLEYENFTLKEILKAIEWINYFNIDKESWFIDIVQNDILLAKLIEYINNKEENKEEINKDTFTKLYRQIIINSKSDVLVFLAILANISPKEFEEELSKYHNRYLTYSCGFEMNHYANIIFSSLNVIPEEWKLFVEENRTKDF